MPHDACTLEVGGREFPVAVEVLEHVNKLQSGVLGSVCLIGEATRIGNAAVDLLEELVHAGYPMTAGQKFEAEALIQQRNGIRAATLRRRGADGEG